MQTRRRRGAPGGRQDDQAEAEEAEAELIEGYLPEQLSDEELSELVAGAVEESGASEAKDMGGVMKVLMPKVGGRADGKRVSQRCARNLARRQLKIDNTVAAELAGSEDAVLRAPEGHLEVDLYLRGNVFTLTGKRGGSGRRRPSSASWST